MANKFYFYFKQNMAAMNLPAPETLFGTLGTALATATSILTQIDKFGPTVTVAELIGAGTALEVFGVMTACSAAYYVGAVIGSIAVATGRSISGGVSIADIMYTADLYNLNRTWLATAVASGR